MPPRPAHKESTHHKTPIRAGTNSPTITPDGKIIGEPTEQRAPPALVQIHRSSTRVQETDDKEEKEVEALAAFMMCDASNTQVALPDLKVEAWPHTGQQPDPISISKAQKLLAAALTAVPCEVPGAGAHVDTLGSLRPTRIGKNGKESPQPW